MLVCHGSPRSDEEIITALSSPERRAPMFDGVAEASWCAATPTTSSTAPCSASGYSTRAASGCPTRTRPPRTGCWLEDGEPALRRTAYDIAAAVERLRASGLPDVDELMLRESLLEPVGSAAVAQLFEERASRVV